MTHAMTPTGVAVLLLLAIAFDVVSIGPAWLRDRVAFLMGTAALYEGFNNSTLDRWTLALATGAIQRGLDATGDAYIAAASAAAIVGVLVGAVYVYALGLVLPQKLSHRLGRIVTVNFQEVGIWKVNWRLWTIAAVLALFCDVPVGWVGEMTAGSVQALATTFAPLPGFLLGGN